MFCVFHQKGFYWDGLLHNQLQLGGFIAQTVAIGKVYCTNSCNPLVAPGPNIATSAALSLVLLQIKNLFGFLQKSLLWWKSLLRNNCVGASERQQVILEGWCRESRPGTVCPNGALILVGDGAPYGHQPVGAAYGPVGATPLRTSRSLPRVPVFQTLPWEEGPGFFLFYVFKTCVFW